MHKLFLLLSLFAIVTAQSTVLSCTGSSTVLSTTDCTKGTPTSYCTYMATATCSPNYYPGYRQVAECVEQPTCYPVPTSTATCNNGFSGSTSTLYSSGTLNVQSVSCTCDGWSSMDYAAGVAPSSYCLPTTSCPSFATASVSINSFCATATVTSCPVSQTKCGCPASIMPTYLGNSFAGCGSIAAGGVGSVASSASKSVGVGGSGNRPAFNMPSVSATSTAISANLASSTSTASAATGAGVTRQPSALNVLQTSAAQTSSAASVRPVAATSTRLTATSNTASLAVANTGVAPRAPIVELLGALSLMVFFA